MSCVSETGSLVKLDLNGCYADQGPNCMREDDISKDISVANVIQGWREVAQHYTSPRMSVKTFQTFVTEKKGFRY